MNQDTKKMLVKSAIVGATNALVGTYYFGNGNISMLGVDLPIYVPLAISGVVASNVTDLVHEKVLGMIPLNEDYANIESLLLGVALSGAANVGVLASTVSNIPVANYVSIGAIGGGSYLAGDWTVNRLLASDNNELIF